MLRLSIRSGAITRSLVGNTSGDVDRRAAQVATETIASVTMDSIVSYLKARRHARPWTTYASILLVEATSRIAPLLKSRTYCPTDTTYKAIASIATAQDCLQDLASINLRVSWRASKQLTAVLEEVQAVITSGRIPRLLSSKVDTGLPNETCPPPGDSGAEDNALISYDTSNWRIEEIYAGEGWEEMLSTWDCLV